MTDTALLKAKIKGSGLKIAYIAEQMGLSRYGLYLKINGENEFTVGEVQCLCNLLRIDSLEEREDIFFAQKVDE